MLRLRLWAIVIEFIAFVEGTSSRSVVTLGLNDSDIIRVYKTKYLGVIIDENWDREEQFKRIRSKIRAGLVNLNRQILFLML